MNGHLTPNARDLTDVDRDLGPEHSRPNVPVPQSFVGISCGDPHGVRRAVINHHRLCGDFYVLI